MFIAGYYRRTGQDRAIQNRRLDTLLESLGRDMANEYESPKFFICGDANDSNWTPPVGRRRSLKHIPYDNDNPNVTGTNRHGNQIDWFTYSNQLEVETKCDPNSLLASDHLMGTATIKDCYKSKVQYHWRIDHKLKFKISKLINPSLKT